MSSDRIDDELKHAPWFLQVPTGDPTDPDLIGPFNTSQQARAFAEAHPDRCKQARVRCMATPVVELLYAELHAAKQRKRVGLVTELGLTSEVLKQPIEPRRT
jgi:hypothetical protein